MAEQKQEITEQVAVGASGIALVAGVIAIGATLLADDETRKRITGKTQQMFANLREVMGLLGQDGKATRTLKPE